MCDKTCGQCEEFMPLSEKCGNPMVYLNHGDNVHRVKSDTQACGFYYPLRQVDLVPKL